MSVIIAFLLFLYVIITCCYGVYHASLILDYISDRQVKFKRNLTILALLLFPGSILITTLICIIISIIAFIWWLLDTLIQADKTITIRRKIK